MQIENPQTDPNVQLEPVRKRRRLLPAVLALACVLLSSFAVARNFYAYATPQRGTQAQVLNPQPPYYVVDQTSPWMHSYNAQTPVVNPNNFAPQQAAPLMVQNYPQPQPPQPGYARTAPNPSAVSTSAVPLRGVLTYANPAEQAAAKEINQLVGKLRDASGEKKAELRKSLNEAVSKQFELRHAAQAKQIERLETELAEAKELHKKRGDRQNEVIERRIAALLDSPDDLAWNRELSTQPKATSNYAVPHSYSIGPNGYSSPNLPNKFYTTPSSGTYQANPYGAAPSYNPNSKPLNPIPQSSTPSQFIPLSSQDSGQTSFIPSTTTEDSKTAAGWSAPAEEQNAKKDDLSIVKLDAEVATGEALLGATVNNSSSRASGTGMSSKAIIEAAYAYEEALEDAIESKKLAATGVVSKRELSTSNRNVAKAKAIWNSMLEELVSQQSLLQNELERQLLSRETNHTPEKRSELESRILQIVIELKQQQSTVTWANEFKKQSLESLEKSLEQSEVRKPVQSEEKRPEQSEVSKPVQSEEKKPEQSEGSSK